MLARRFKKAFSLKELEEIFLESSKDINGTISLKELKRIIKNMDIVLDEDELENRVNKNELLINYKQNLKLILICFTRVESSILGKRLT